MKNNQSFAGKLPRAGLVVASIIASAAGIARGEGDERQVRTARTGQVVEESHFSSRAQAVELRNAAPSTAPAWKSEGPWGMGRINAVEVDPKNDQILYVGAAGGGLWKSTNGGGSYTALLPDGDQSIGAIAIAPSNSAVVWMGGGENMYGGGSQTYPGTGVWKSTDGGATWKHMGLDSSFYISRISISPDNPDKVFVAVQGSVWGTNKDRGIYMTKDGGATWKQVLGPLSGVPGYPANDFSTGAVDVRIHPTNPLRVFANMFTAQRLPYGRTWGGANSRVWRSDDGGETWKVLGAAEGLPTTNLGKSTMDFCQGTPTTAYMVYHTAANTLNAVYRSNDGGMTWATTASSPNSGSLYSYYAHTFGQIRVNPTNPNDVVVMGISSYRTTNGGSSWALCFSNAHADHRGMAWSRTNGNLVYLGDDGSLKKSTAGPNGALSSTGGGVNGMNIAQIYSLDVSPDNANYRYAGFQDNGAQYTTNGGQTWSTFVGGDGMQIRVDHGSYTNVLGASQYGAFSLSTNRGTSRSGVSGFTGRKLWDAGVAIDSATGFSYLGSQYVHRAAKGSGSYTRISDDLTNGDHSVANYPMGTISAISAHKNFVFAGTDDGNLWVNTAGSTSSTWTKIREGRGTGPGTEERNFDGWIKLISPDYNSAGNVALVAVSYFRWGMQYWKPSLLQYTMTGTTAEKKDISGDLPPRITTNKVIKDGRGYLYAATDYGPYYSSNGGVNWNWLGDKNLPILPVNDMVIHQGSNTLFIATYGRGIWSLPLGQVTPVAVEPWSVATGSASQYLNSAPNPVVTSARIQFQVARDQKLFVAIYDMAGRQVAALMNGKAAGGKVHTLTWNRTKNVERGFYLLRVIGDRVTMARKLEVR